MTVFITNYKVWKSKETLEQFINNLNFKVCIFRTKCYTKETFSFFKFKIVKRQKALVGVKIATQTNNETKRLISLMSEVQFNFWRHSGVLCLLKPNIYTGYQTKELQSGLDGVSYK